MKFEELTNSMIEAMREVVPWLNECHSKVSEHLMNVTDDELAESFDSDLQDAEQKWMQEFTKRLQEPLKKYLPQEYVDKIRYGRTSIYIDDYVLNDGKKVRVCVFPSRLSVLDLEAIEVLEGLERELDLGAVFVDLNLELSFSHLL